MHSSLCRHVLVWSLVATLSTFLITPALAGFIPHGLTAAYDFNSAITDASGAGLSLTAGGDFEFAADRFGASAAAIHFTTPDPTTGTFLLGYGPDLAGHSSSISLWLRKDPGFGTSSWLLGLGHAAGESGEDGKDMHIGVNYGGPIRYSFFHDDLDVNVSFGNVWTHLAFTFDNTTMQRRVYVDGALAATDTAAYGFTGDQHLKLGMAGVTLDELSFYSRVLEVSEIEEISANRPSASGPSAPSQVPDSAATGFLLLGALTGLTRAGRRYLTA